MQQGREALRFGVPLSVLNSQLIGERDTSDPAEAPLWDYADLFDDKRTAETIDLALLSNDNSKVQKWNNSCVQLFVERLEAWNESLSDLQAATGIPASPVRYMISGDDFRYQIELKERGIAAALTAIPEISHAYVNWMSEVAAAAGPRHRRVAHISGFSKFLTAGDLRGKLDSSEDVLFGHAFVNSNGAEDRVQCPNPHRCMRRNGDTMVAGLFCLQDDVTTDLMYSLISPVLVQMPDQFFAA